MSTLCILVLVALQGGACSPGEATVPSPFNGERALGYVRTFMDFGARVPGTDAHKRAGDWITSEMRQRADTVIEQVWTHTTQAGVKLPLRNVLARFNPMAEERLLYVTHWDSRPVADKSSTDSLRKLPTPGANDGGSGVGLFLALGDVLKQTPPGLGVDLLFVDGEDYGDFTKTPKDVLIGSRYYAAHPVSGPQPLYAVLFDLVADKDLQIFEEGNSLVGAPEVVELVWNTAKDLGYAGTFVATPKHTLIDDHLELQKTGIRAIDVVDFDYPSWHTKDDTIDKVSAASLQIVGDVAVALVRREE